MKKKQKIIVLGAGLVGGVIAADLNRRFNVTSADIDQDVLLKVEKEGVDVIITDLSDPENIRKSSNLLILLLVPCRVIWDFKQ